MAAFENNAADKLLMARIKNDEEAAFRALFDKYFTALCRNAAMFVRRQEIAEEVVLDVFTNLWNRRRQTDIHSSVRLFLFRSVRNRSLNHLRDTKYNLSLNEFTDFIPEDAPTDLLETEELDYFIQEAIMSLPDKCREIFVESRTRGKSNKEIADTLNISVKTVETQITRAIRRIREHLNHIYTLFL